MKGKESILIVDDDKSTCRTLSLIFGKEGYVVETAGTGREALEKAQGRFYNMILLDIRLPDMEGIKLLAPLKKMHPDMVVVMVTGYASMETAVRALNEGASAYLTKPLNMDEVLATTRGALEKQLLVAEKRQADEMLRESSEKLRSIFASSPDAITVSDLKGNITECNQATLEMHGFSSKDELIGKNAFMLIVKKDHKRARENLKKALKQGSVRDIEYTFLTKDGPEFPAELSANVMRDASGAHKGFVAVTKNITERKRMEQKLKAYSKNLEQMVEKRTLALRESEERFRGIAERSIDVIFELDPEGHINYVSPAMKRMGGYISDELIGKPFQDIVVESKIPMAAQTFIETVKDRIVEGLQMDILRKDGSVVSTEFTGSPIFKDGETVGVQGILRDITERRKMMEMRDRFISSVTHELRTPLISIKGYIDYLLSGKMGQITDKVYSSLDVVRRNTDRLLSLVNDLLDIQRITSGKLKLNRENLDFRDIINDCVKEINPLLEEKNLKFTIKIPQRPLRMNGDCIRLCQVIMNLLSNASKFTPEGGTITLQVEEKKDSLHVQISDTGIGVKEEDRIRIFEAFADIEKSVHIKGTGLGLNVTKSLVEAHGGRIWVESEGEGKGTTLIFILPKKKGRKQ